MCVRGFSALTQSPLAFNITATRLKERRRVISLLVRIVYAYELRLNYPLSTLVNFIVFKMLRSACTVKESNVNNLEDSYVRWNC